ncbi:MAG: HAD family hydrolase [Candidatus Limnocylindrales bacterium]
MSTTRANPLCACIFDFDGVVVDSKPVHAEAKRQTLDQYRIAYSPTIFDVFKGRTDVDFFEHVAARLSSTGPDAATLLTEKRRRYLSLVADVQLMPGFKAFLELARRRFDRLGIATSATRSDFDLVARRHTFLGSIDAVVTSDDTTRSKPDPEPYRAVMARLAVEPTEVLVIEDSPNGVRSAAAAGAYVVALATAFDPIDLATAGANLVVADFQALARELDDLLDGR